jgi:DNA polymerase I
MAAAPWNTGSDAVTVAYYASAELGCFRALSWPDPANVVDLFAEFRSETNGLALPCGHGLIGALAYFGLSAMTWGEKENMRELILRGSPWTPEEQVAILDYCAEDVEATARLLQAMSPSLTGHSKRVGYAVLRGRYMGSVAAMEHTGVPIDVQTFDLLKARWNDVQEALIREIDSDFDVYDGRTFKADRFASWLTKTGTPWPRLESGALALDDDTFHSMARAYPVVSPLRELRHALGEMRLSDISVGPDGRNRTLISPFRSRTGRNQPSNSRFIFGASVWLRGLIKPTENMAIAYLDFSSQEIAIAAALSKDEALWRAYESGDPYIQFAIDAGLAPIGATKATHGAVRSRCKTIVLGTQYGMSAQGMAAAAAMSLIEARQ